MEFKKMILSIAIFIVCQDEFTQGNDDLEKHDSFSEDEDSDTEVFKPTFEWQELKKGQAIPKGLHVQLDLTTGVRRAKLLDPSDNVDHTSLLVVPGQTESESEIPEKKLPINLDNIGAVDPETLTQVKQKYRSFKKIQEDFKSLELDLKTDMEILNDLMGKFKEIQNMKSNKYTDVNPGEDDQWLNILLDLEYLVHQVDNARLFIKMNGIEDVVFPSLNSSSSEIRAEGARLLGAACQNNVPSQIVALESGGIRVLLHMFSSDVSSSVQSSALYALSCIIRNFPIAQKKLIDDGGLGVLNSVFDGESSEKLKLQVKILTLVDDLMTERREVEEIIQSLNNSTAEPLGIAKEKQRQYNSANLEAKLLEHQWCQHLINILLKQISVEDLNGLSNDKQVIHQLNHDNIEKIITAMLSISVDCENEFKASLLLKKTLSNLVLWYKELSDEEINEGDEDGYYTGLQKNIESMLLKLV